MINSAGEVKKSAECSVHHPDAHALSSLAKRLYVSGYVPLGTEIGLSLGDIVLDGDPAPPSQKKGTALTQFWPMSIVAKRLDGSTWHLVRR